MTQRQWIIILIKSFFIGTAIGWFFAYRNLFWGITLGLITAFIFLGAQLILKTIGKRKNLIMDIGQDNSKRKVVFYYRYWRSLFAILIMALVLGTLFLFDINQNGRLSFNNISLPEFSLYVIVFLGMSTIFFVRLKGRTKDSESKKEPMGSGPDKEKQ